MKLSYKHGGVTDSINLYSDPPSMHRLAINRNGQTYYAKLGETNHPEASNLHFRRNGKTFAAMKNYDPVIFDECGNTWTIEGSPTLTTENAIFGKALQIGGENAGSLTLSKNLIEPGQDFSVDAYVTVKSLSSGVGVYIYLIGNNYRWTVASFSASRHASKLQCDRLSSPSGTFLLSYFPDGSVQIGERHHFAWSYTHHNNRHYWILDGSTIQLASHALWDGTVPLDTIKIAGSSSSSVSIEEFRVCSGIALWTEPFTLPTAPYEVDEFTKALLHF